MRRVGGLWPEVTKFENLLRATQRAAQGKRQQRHVARFLIERERLLLKLQRELLSQRYRPGPMTRFVIRDPKLRTISVAPFRDRVVHHAVIDVLDPILDRRMIHASFACRRGKGTHAARTYAQARVRRHRWFLKMDVERFFASIPHTLVMTTISRIIKDRLLLRLIGQIIEAGGEAPGRGLPIGSLTSQWFANLVLDALDRRAVERMKLPGYVRYMDDFVCFADERVHLRETRSAL